MKKSLIALAIAIGGVGMAQADSKAQTGLVYTVQGGYSLGFSPASEVDDHGNFTYGGSVGYDFALADFLAIGPEVGINYTSDIAKYSNATGSQEISLMNVPIMARAKFIIPDYGFNVFIKGGINYQRINTDGSATGIGMPSGDENNWNGVAAAGLGYQIDTFNVFAQYMVIFGQDLKTSLDSGDTIGQNIITGGVSYTLPM